MSKQTKTKVRTLESITKDAQKAMSWTPPRKHMSSNGRIVKGRLTVIDTCNVHIKTLETLVTELTEFKLDSETHHGAVSVTISLYQKLTKLRYWSER